MRSRVIALVCLIVSAACGAAGEAAAADVRIGVVNVREVFARYRKAEDLKKADEERLMPRQKELERRQRELVRRAGELSEFGEGEDQEAARLRNMKELEYQESIFKLDYRQFQRDIQAVNERLMRKVWDDVKEVCRRVAEDEGFDLVVKSYGPDPAATTDRERLEAYQGDALLYAAPSVDITARVLEVLENAYRRGIKLVPDDGDEESQPPGGGNG
jgi:Skp family chaperone for outer membrane proteins